MNIQLAKRTAKSFGTWFIVTEVLGWVAMGVWVYYFGVPL
jgi:hypothetical protein